MILNINQLRAFATAARLKSITLAAQELMVTVPAITMQIRRLEQGLGLSLMYRQGNSIRLTEPGKTVFLRSSHIFEEIKDMEKFLGKLTIDTSGVLRIGCPQTPAKYVMPKLIMAFKKAYPDVKIVLSQGTSSEVLEGIKSQIYDLGIIHCAPTLRNIKVMPLAREDIMLVCSPNSTNIRAGAVSAAQLSTIPLIMPKEGSATREVVLSYLRRFNVTPFIVLEATSVDLMKELVKDDQGTSLMVRSAVRDDLQNGLLKSISIVEGSPVIEYGIAYQQRKYLSPAAWAFVRLAAKSEDIVCRT
jgi:DNA-binding transcriptional LysR family regulator